VYVPLRSLGCKGLTSVYVAVQESVYILAPAIPMAYNVSHSVLMDSSPFVVQMMLPSEYTASPLHHDYSVPLHLAIACSSVFDYKLGCKTQNCLADDECKRYVILFLKRNLRWHVFKRLSRTYFMPPLSWQLVPERGSFA
jgi:hypothetical protein